MRRSISARIGWAYIGLALLLNPWVLGHVLSPGGSIEATSKQLAIGAVQLGLLAVGVLTLRWGDRPWVANLNLLLFSSALTIPLTGEAIIRLALALGMPAFRRPALYADYFSDDDHWVLQQRWGGKWRSAAPDRVHVLLGWSQTSVTEANPLGLLPTTLARLAAPAPAILFFGDSFVRGAADQPFQLPEYLNDRLPGRTVVDLSVGGYGLDQIYLMFQALRPHARGRLCLVGILVNDDLDRTVLSVRTSQKPYFVVDDHEGLLLRGVPIQRDQAAFFREARLSFRSYLLAFFEHRLLGSDQRMALKQQVSAALLRRLYQESRDDGGETIFVVFYAASGLRATSWQEEFLRSSLEELGATVFDTKPLLLGYARAKGIDIETFYQAGDGHHNNAGNQVIGEGLVSFLKDRPIPTATPGSGGSP